MLARPTPDPAAVTPLRPTLFDAQGRHITYLRLSVTDRCNFRCAYCSPASWGGKADLLTAEELGRIAGVFAQLGIKRVRLTGGEPLLRPDILEIASRIASLPGIENVAITTNAARLAQLAEGLKAAGVTQLNASLDTLREETFRKISARGELADVLAGIEAAASARFASFKLNVVVMKGVNDGEAAELVRFAHARCATPRFIELMPFGQGTPVPTRELIERLRADGIALEAATQSASALAVLGPARYYRTPEGGEVGFISPLTDNFCGGCNRVRVSAKGELRACLGGREQVPMAQLVRSGASDEEIAAQIRVALGEKQEGHRFNDLDARARLLSMMGIGG